MGIEVAETGAVVLLTVSSDGDPVDIGEHASRPFAERPVEVTPSQGQLAEVAER